MNKGFDKMPSPRKAALEILTRIEKDKSYSNLVIDSYLKKFGAEPKDAALITALVYGVLENIYFLDYQIAHFAKRDSAKLQQNLRNILRVGAYQIVFMNKIPVSAAVNESVLLTKSSGCAYASGFVNAVLREIARNLDRLPLPSKEDDYKVYLHIKYSCPEWLIDKWLIGYGRETTEGMLENLSQKPPVVVRVNTLKTTPEGLIETLHEQQIVAKRSQISDGALELERMPNLRSLNAFAQGLFTVQDYASQLCCLALGAKSGETVFDMCAAPGSKSFTLGFLMGGVGQIRAFELYENRLSLIKSGAKRLGLDLITAEMNDALVSNESLGVADRVLCDVPCSGLGVIRRKPEIRYKNPVIFDDLPNIQYSILSEGARHVKPGGTLIYSTCTLNPDENEAVAKRFLDAFSDFEALILPEAVTRAANKSSITLFPHINGTDGFFIAGFKKRDNV